MPRYLPTSIVCFREGYTARSALSDVLAGITVGIIALPLAIAFGIASIPEGQRCEGFWTVKNWGFADWEDM